MKGKPGSAPATERRFAIGDAVLASPLPLGEALVSVAETTGLSVATVRRFATVARAIGPTERAPGVGWKGHEAVAALAPDHRRRVLQEIEAGALTVTEVRRSATERHKRRCEDTRTVTCR